MIDLTTGKEGRRIFNFAVPLLIGSVFQQMYNVVDSVVVGRVLGKEALAAVGNSFPIMLTLIALIIGVAFGGTIVISQYFGAKDYEKVRRAIGTLYVLMFSMAAILTLVGFIFMNPVLALLDIPPEILGPTKTYLGIIIGGLVIFFGYNGTAAILKGLGDSKTPMVFIIISTFFNIGLDLLFVIKFGWGVAGVAVATLISQGGAFLTAVWYLNRYHKLISIGLKHFVFDREIFIQSIRIGLPTGLQQTFVALGMMALLKIVNGFGTDVIAAYSVAGRIDSIAMMPAMIFSQALAAFVGQNIGAGRLDRVRNGMISTFIMSSLVAVLLTLGIILLRYPLIMLFNQDPEVVRIGSEYLIIVSSCYLIFSGMFTINGLLRGAGDTLIPMFITLFALWLIRIPSAVFLSGKLGETGIWWAMPVGWAAGLIMSLIYYRTGNWRKKSIIRKKDPVAEAEVTETPVIVSAT